MARCGSRTMLSGAPEVADRLSDLPLKQLVKLPDLAEKARGDLERNANATLLITQFCASLRGAIDRS